MARAYLPLARRPSWQLQLGSVSSHLLVMMLGVGLGVLAMWLAAATGLWSYASADRVDTAPASALTPQVRSAADSVRLSPLFEVSITYEDGSTSRLPALALELEDGTLGVVTSLVGLIDASAALVPVSNTRAVRLDQIRAVAPELQLVLMGTDRAETEALFEGLTPAPVADAALHLGRPLTLLASGGLRQEGFVDSPARRADLGAYWYALNLGLSAVPSPAAIVDGQNRLIGIAVRSLVAQEASSAPVGLDLQALTSLLYPAPAATTDLQDFVDSFFHSNDIGRLLAVERAAGRADWQTVISAGADLVYLAYPIADRVRPRLEQAFQVSIADALGGNGGIRRAQQLLDEASRLLGWSPSRRVLAARAARAEGDIPGALGQLNTAQQEAQADPSTQATLREATRRLMGDLLAGGQLGPQEAVTLLQAQLQLDPDHADYHAALGRQLFELGRYREALPALFRARALDGARFGDEFGSLIALAQERLYAPGVTVVPVQSQGATLFVNGTIPGASGTFRFILDTGASITAISPRVAAQLPGLSSRGTVRLSTANGQVDAPLVTLPSLDIAGARVAQLDVVVLDSLSSYDGLLGLSFLDHFNMELDRNRNEMTLRLR